MSEPLLLKVTSLKVPLQMEETIRNCRCGYMLGLLSDGRSPNEVLSIPFQYRGHGSAFLMSCLEYAVYQCDISMVSLLFIHGADPAQNVFTGRPLSRGRRTDPSEQDQEMHPVFADGAIPGFMGLHAVVTLVEDAMADIENIITRHIYEHRHTVRDHRAQGMLYNVSRKTSLGPLRSTLRLMEAGYFYKTGRLIRHPLVVLAILGEQSDWLVRCKKAMRAATLCINSASAVAIGAINLTSPPGTLAPSPDSLKHTEK